MKTYIYSALCLFFATASLQAQAEAEELTATTVTGNKTFSLKTSHDDVKGSLTVEIKDSAGQIVYNKNLSGIAETYMSRRTGIVDLQKNEGSNRTVITATTNEISFEYINKRTIQYEYRLLPKPDLYVIGFTSSYFHRESDQEFTACDVNLSTRKAKVGVAAKVILPPENFVTIDGFISRAQRLPKADNVSNSTFDMHPYGICNLNNDSVLDIFNTKAVSSSEIPKDIAPSASGAVAPSAGASAK